MTKGGSRNRSGPAPDPNSRTSERRGYVLTALPSEGYRGLVPEFPLPAIYRMHVYFADKQRITEVDEGATENFRDRELDIWAESWMTPQACAWSLEPWRFRIIGEYCRLAAVVELDPDANASLVAQLHRFRDQIGLTPAGLRENGWAIAQNEVAAKAAAKKSAKPAAAPAQRRLRSADAQQ